MITAVKYEEVFSNTCGCYDCPSCGALETNDESAPNCYNCGTTTVPSEYCMDACWEYKHENWQNDIFPEWLTLMNEPQYLKVEGSKMGWTRASGYLIVESDWDIFYKVFSINGEYRLKFLIEGESFTVQRYSHDEPMGASFTIKPTPTCVECLYAAEQCNC